MSYYADYWRKEAREESEKAWVREKAVPWYDRWQSLSHAARLAYLTRIKGAAKEGALSQPGSPADQVPADAVKELVAAGFVELEPGKGKKGDRIVPVAATHHFSTKLRANYRYQLLNRSSREELAKYVKYAFYSQGEPLMARVLAGAGIQHYPRLDEGLEQYVTSWRWPGWAAKSIKAPKAEAVLEALIEAKGPVRTVDLPKLVHSAKPEELDKALEALIANLAVFEDLDPKTLDPIVGLLPVVRERLIEARKPRHRPPLVVSSTVKDTTPASGTSINDLRVFLLEVAGESPRLRQDGGIFQKDLPRFEAALPTWPDWLDAIVTNTPEIRVEDAHRLARSFDFVETEGEEKQTWLRLSGKGRNWLASGMEDQYRVIYDWFRAYEKKARYSSSYDYDYDYRYSHGYDPTVGDALFLGVSLVTSVGKRGSVSYYSSEALKPEQRQAQRDAIYRAWDQLKVGEFYTWESVLDHLAFEDKNPLIAGRDAATLTIFLQQRPVPNLPERQEAAGKALLGIMLKTRLLPFDAVRAGMDDRDRVCIARLPRLDGYFGRKYDAGAEPGSDVTRVIVQPDFSVVVIGLDPAPAAEFAPFCERTRGHLGEGAITFRITRESVVRATSQGLSGAAIVARLKKHASVGVPDNVLAEVREWADWVRLVNIRQVTVVRCPDSPTADRVVAALGKKAERLGPSMVALGVSKLSSVERDKLQGQGIIITKDDIAVAKPAAEPTIPTPKKRGRPKKAR